MQIKICGGLNDVESPLDEILYQTIIPRIDDIIYFKNKRYKVYEIIIDYDYNEISVYVKDSIK